MIEIENSGWDFKALGDVDHRFVYAPYLRLDTFKKVTDTDYIMKYDIRFTQPNKIFISSAVLHSIEHFFLDWFRGNVKNFIGVAPMGCNTGFYLILLNEINSKTIVNYIDQALRAILIAKKVPLVSDICCGNAKKHDLEGSKILAKEILSKKSKWLDVF